MYDLIKDMLTKAAKDMDSTVVMSASDNLFEVEKKICSCSVTKSQTFHNITKSLLFSRKEPDWTYKWLQHFNA